MDGLEKFCGNSDQSTEITANAIAIAILAPLFYFAVTFLITYSGQRKLHIFAAPAYKNELAEAKNRPFCPQGRRRSC
ncbi:MAG: hypothetical protein HGB15_03585 [Chlorobaculum sp.]|jgi:hypothetical protein|nr:hypothetical protein [Chlorobaculum sp.]